MASGRAGLVPAVDAGCGLKSAVGENSACSFGSAAIVRAPSAVGTVAMDMKYVEAFGGEPPEAYERLLLDAMRGDATLFSRRDAVEASWEWVTPILDHFEKQPPQDFSNYEPGSWGPSTCWDLMRRDRRSWREL